jgi:D-serine dehydratase
MYMGQSSGGLNIEDVLESESHRAIDQPQKALPAAFTGSLAEIGSKQWSIYGDVPLPTMALDRPTMLANIEKLHGYIHDRGAYISPHAKTTMCPAIWAEQLAGGAWGLTVANVSQLEICVRYRVPRVLVANEVTDRYSMNRLARIIAGNPWVSVMCLVDSAAAVDALAEAVTAEDPTARLDVLVEFGMIGGRAGVRTIGEVAKVARLVTTKRSLRLVGLHGYEGILGASRQPEVMHAVDAYLANWTDAVTAALEHVGADTPNRIATAGGSIFFDRVLEAFEPLRGDCDLVLRSGGYVTHDSLLFDSASPFGSTAPLGPGSPLLEAALKVHASVLSRPEPDLLIVGSGVRDVPVSEGLPVVLRITDPDGNPRDVRRAETTRVNDQHLYLRVDDGGTCALGDIVELGISHPCAAFERWRVLFEADDEGRITGAMRTFF